jgi:hypothetical protein
MNRDKIKGEKESIQSEEHTGQYELSTSGGSGKKIRSSDRFGRKERFRRI